MNKKVCTICEEQLHNFHEIDVIIYKFLMLLNTGFIFIQQNIISHFFLWFWVEIWPGHVSFWEIHPYTTLRWAWHKKKSNSPGPLCAETRGCFWEWFYSPNGSTVHWNKEVNRRCRKEGKCSLWSGRGSGGKDVQLRFFFCAQEDQKRNPENKKPSSPTNTARSEGASSYGYQRGRGAHVLGGGSAVRQMRDVSVCVCVHVCISGCVYCPQEPC